MKVADLQQFVRSLSAPLSTSGASKVAGELDRVCTGFEPFNDMTLAEFADFLVLAHTYKRDGVLATGTRSRGKAAVALDRSKVDKAAQQVQQLYERAADPELQYTTIEGEIKKLDRALNKDEAIAVAVEVGIAKPMKTKKAALDEIKGKITTRKGSYERSQFGPPDQPTATAVAELQPSLPVSPPVVEAR
jgi:hypothetical protein